MTNAMNTSVSNYQITPFYISDWPVVRSY